MPYGGCFLNEEIRRVVAEKLKDETYLSNKELKLDMVLDQVESLKANYQGDRETSWKIDIEGLQANKHKGFFRGLLLLNGEVLSGLIVVLPLDPGLMC